MEIPLQNEKLLLRNLLKEYKNIEVSDKLEFEILNKNLLSKAIEFGLPEWLAITIIQEHLKEYVRIAGEIIEKKPKVENIYLTGQKYIINQNSVNESKENTNYNQKSIDSSKSIEDINNDCIKSINYYYESNDYRMVTIQAGAAEISNKLFFQNSLMAKKYLWSMMNYDIEKAYVEVDRILKIVIDNKELQDTIGMIYRKKGEKTKDLNLLKNALQYFQSNNYYDKEFGLERINNTIKIINSVKIERKLELLGVNSSLIKQISNNEFKKIWKVNYLINSKHDGFVYQYTPMIFIPTNGELTSKGAVAFLKAKSGLLGYGLSEYLKIGEKYPTINDKSKIEIIDFYEITFD
jgi:hypothetical protein